MKYRKISFLEQKMEGFEGKLKKGIKHYHNIKVEIQEATYVSL